MVKVEIQFKSTTSMIGYGGKQGLKDGDIKEVEEDEAKRLCKDFPDNFSIVKAVVEEKKPEQSETKDAGPPRFDKSQKSPERNK